MNYFSRVVIFGILVVIITELISCIYSGWCVGDKRREGRNLEMFTIYFMAGVLSCLLSDSLMLSNIIIVKEVN